MTDWEDRLVEKLKDPDDIGTSEYRTLHDHVLQVIESANISGDDPKQMVLVSLDELEIEINALRMLVEETA